jgi:hypothetical protein
MVLAPLGTAAKQHIDGVARPAIVDPVSSAKMNSHFENTIAY